MSGIQRSATKKAEVFPEERGEESASEYKCYWILVRAQTNMHDNPVISFSIFVKQYVIASLVCKNSRESHTKYTRKPIFSL